MISFFTTLIDLQLDKRQSEDCIFKQKCSCSNKQVQVGLEPWTCVTPGIDVILNAKTSDSDPELELTKN